MAASLTLLSGCLSPEPIESEGVIVEPQTDVVESDTGDLRIITWNIHGRAAEGSPDHIERVAETIAELNPDIAFLQEVHRGTRRARGIDQLLELTTRTGMRACFAPALDLAPGEYGPATLVRGPIEYVDVDPLPGRGEPRILIRCRTELLDREIDLFPIHLTAWGQLNRGPRRLQTSAIAEALDEAEHPIAGGDFNASLDSPEMRVLIGTELQTPRERNYVTHPGTGQSFDHILVAPTWEIEEFEVITEGPSDHWPVFLRVTPRDRELIN